MLYILYVSLIPTTLTVFKYVQLFQYWCMPADLTLLILCSIVAGCSAVSNSFRDYSSGKMWVWVEVDAGPNAGTLAASFRWCLICRYNKHIGNMARQLNNGRLCMNVDAQICVKDA